MPVGIGNAGTVKGRKMARALLGYVGSGSEQVLSLEVIRLRRRVALLEAELAELRDSSRDLEPSLEIELHRLAEHAAPALA
jgi:hypothetical protein